MIEATVVSLLTWAHDEAVCPSCRLPIEAHEVDEELREPRASQHRRVWGWRAAAFRS
jgi:hypothetical protein